MYKVEFSYPMGVWTSESYDDAYNRLMNEPLFDGEELKNILDKIEWLEG